MKYWNQIRSKTTVLIGMLLLTALFFAYPASAGWNTEEDGKTITYTDEKGKTLTGLQVIKGQTYYFNSKGVLQTGWIKLPDGRKVYFLEDGKMAVNRWVEDHTFFVDETGNMLCTSVTKDGYVLKANGRVKKKLSKSGFFKLAGKWYFYKKKKGLLKNKVFKFEGYYYYVNEKGVRQSGWVTWKGHDYYFLKDGTAVTGTRKIGSKTYTFGSKGRLHGKKESAGKEDSGKPAVLILCGHGQGDSGAVGCNGQFRESVYTRDFGRRIYKALKKNKKTDVVLFNTNYDMFQQVRSTLGSVSPYTGTGKRRKKLLKALRRNSRIPELTEFDYVLEVHFNATAPAGKDPGGNGSVKGTGIYINSYKSAANTKIDRKIIRAINKTGLKTWGAGVYRSSGLTNARVFTELGINYSLLETCFIDDRDDMKFYLKKRDKMAAAVAKAIVKFVT